MGARLRDVIYLSAGKLRQFLPEPRRTPRTAGVRLSTPFGFGVDVDAQDTDGEQGRIKHLRQVQRHLEETALWYGDPGLRPGTWVQFEAPMRCVTLRGNYRDLLLFVDSRPGSGSGDAAGCRLLLHGSAQHLLGWAPQLAEGPALSEMVGGDSIGTVFLTKAGEVVEALSSASAPQPAASADALPVSPLAPAPSATGLRDLLDALDAGREDIDTTAPMFGYARVTALLPGRGAVPRCLVASPLMVEYAGETP
ncbi:SAVMC3_10250 family protein [Streptomyces griseus]|uniref:SAVMC3_10250 family protein n=1 Tax=Streptomyces griseus TaxID=1911 RepID=UPI0004CB4002|nr:SAVMC3_10250 family protein [Streptomyces griseus]